MRRRFLISFTLLIGLAAAVFLGFWAMQPRPRIDQETLDKIQIGMTEREVIDIIGAPPGDYGVGNAEVDDWDPTARGRWPAMLKLDDDERSWLGHEKAIVVAFDETRKVSGKRLANVWRDADSHFDV